MSHLPWHLHVFELLTLVGLAILQRIFDPHVRSRLATSGWIVLALSTAWPLGDLAASVSITAATVQRLLIMLLAAPLLVISTSTEALVRWTSSPLRDALASKMAHPVIALLFVTVVGTLTLSVPVVAAGARSLGARELVIAVVVLCGLVLWAPVLAIIPGAKRLSNLGRAGYVFGSSLLVTSFSLVWIFSRHSMYHALHHQHEILGLTPLLDQQVAGFVAKLGAYIPMWIVAAIIFSRADHANQGEESPLHWVDVERHFLRAERREARESHASGAG